MKYNKRIKLLIQHHGSISWLRYDSILSTWGYHNNNGLAIVTPRGTKKWYINDKQHRLDGPAVEYYDGDTEWVVNGINYDTEFEYWLAVQNYNNTWIK